MVSPKHTGDLNYTKGSVIRYNAFGGEPREVVVEERLEYIKNGEPGFTGFLVTPEGQGLAIWGYDYQITEVVSNPDLPRQRKLREAWERHAELWPAEKKRVETLISGSTFLELKEFVLEYQEEWVEKIFGEGKAQRTRFQPGEIVFEIDTRRTWPKPPAPYNVRVRTTIRACLFIGSFRDRTDNASVRFVIDSNHRLRKVHTIVRMDEVDLMSSDYLWAYIQLLIP